MLQEEEKEEVKADLFEAACGIPSEKAIVVEEEPNINEMVVQITAIFCMSIFLSICVVTVE